MSNPVFNMPYDKVYHTVQGNILIRPVIRSTLGEQFGKNSKGEAMLRWRVLANKERNACIIVLHDHSDEDAAMIRLKFA